MSARLFAEWKAYCAIEPFGPPADFYQAALVASMLANVNRTKKGQKVYTPEDFMPKTMTQQEPTEEEAAQLTSRIRDRFQAYNELVNKQGQHG